MNILAIWAIFNCIIIIWLGHFIYYRDPESPLNRIFAALCLSVGLWAFAWFMFLHAPSFSDALVWMKINALFWTLPSALVLNFSLVFANKKTVLSRRFLYLWIYGPAAAFSALDVTTDLLTEGPTVEFGRYVFGGRVTSVLFWVGSSWAIGLATSAVIICLRVYLRASNPGKKQQAKYITIGLSIPVFSAALTSLLLPSLKINFPNLTIASMTGLVVFVAYAIHRYQLFAVNATTAAENILSTMHDSLILIDPQGKILAANKAIRDLLGYSSDELLGRPAAKIFADRKLADRISEERAEGPDVRNYETAYRAKDGKLEPVLFSSSELKDHRGSVAGLVIVAKDIAKRKETELALKFSEARFRAIADTAVEALITIDTKSRILFWNGAAERQFGYTAKEALGREISIIVPERYRAAHKRGLARFMATNQARILGKTVELQALRRDGREFPVELSIAAYATAEGTSFTGIIRDITERKQAQADIEYMAYHDPLTGLPNRSLFFDRLHQSLALAKRNNQMLAVLYLDLNKFKSVNDELGHDAGDYLLTVVGKRLVHSLRETDTVARVGGDEFNVLLPNIRRTRDASEMAEKILTDISAPLLIDEHKISVSAGLGISIYPNDGETAETLISGADLALRYARTTGSKYHFFTKKIHGQTVDHVELEKDLGKALDRNEFIIYYQPYVDPERGRIVGIEALLRWRHPQRGMLPPAAFIPIAEETGLIGSINNWALLTACRQNKEWQQAGLPPLKLAVNLSIRRLQQTDLAETVEHIINGVGLAPQYLSLELTETAIIDNPDVSATILSALAAKGIDMAVDDFGAGYSSLFFLKRFHIDTLNIAGAFIRDMTGNTETAATAGAIVSMAHALNLNVIAKDVETMEQLKFARSIKSDAAQGSLFGRPMAAEHFKELLKDGRSLPKAA